MVTKKSSSKQKSEMRQLSIFDTIALETKDEDVKIEEYEQEKRAKESKVPISERRQYELDKKKVYELEKVNTDSVYALQSVGSDKDPDQIFFKIAMRSLLYINELHSREIGFKFGTAEDSDFTRPTFRDGVILIKSLQKLIGVMASFGAFYSENQVEDYPGILRFDLPSPVSGKLLYSLKVNNEMHRRQNTLHYSPENIIPEMERALEAIDERIVYMLRAATRSKRLDHYDLVYDASEIFARLQEDFQIYENGMKSTQWWKPKFEEQLMRLKARITRAFRGEAISEKQYSLVGQKIAQLEIIYKDRFVKSKNKGGNEITDNEWVEKINDEQIKQTIERLYPDY